MGTGARAGQARARGRLRGVRARAARKQGRRKGKEERRKRKRRKEKEKEKKEEERKREGKKEKGKRRKKKEEMGKRERDAVGFAVATAGSVEHARRSGGTQSDTRNEERGRRLISVSDGENAGKDFEELGSRTEGEFEMIRAKCRKDFEKIFLTSNLFGRIFRMLQLSLH